MSYDEKALIAAVQEMVKFVQDDAEQMTDILPLWMHEQMIWGEPVGGGQIRGLENAKWISVWSDGMCPAIKHPEYKGHLLVCFKKVGKQWCAEYDPHDGRIVVITRESVLTT